MPHRLTLDSVCAPSQDIVSREIEGEIVIVPLTSGIGDAEDELYSLNDAGRSIWVLLDGKRSLREVVITLLGRFDAPRSEMERDVLSFVEEMVDRGMLVTLALAKTE